MRSAPLLLLAGCAPAPDETGTGTPPPGTHTETGETDSPPVGAGPSEVVLQGEILGFTTAADPWIAGVVASSGLPASGSTLQLYVSRATTADAIEAGLVAGLHPEVKAVTSLAFDLVPGPVPGSYVFSDYEAPLFPWGQGGHSIFEPGKVGAWNGTASVELPAWAIVSLPETLPLGQGLTIDFANQGFTSNVTLVLDDAGAVTWSNDPSTLSDLVAANELENTSSVTLPAAAFPVAGEYVVALAACTRTFPTDLTDLEPALTAIRAGLVEYRKLTVE